MRTRGPTVLRGLLLAAWASSVAAVPIKSNISVDGRFSDWTEVLTNADNISRDGDGSTLGCTGSTDRDCPIVSGELDLARFAWTWSDADFFFYLERRGSANAPSSARVHLDLGADGLLDASDVVVTVDLPRFTSQGTLEVRAYVPASPGGDSLTDAAGFADGYDMPGSLGALLASGGGTGFAEGNTGGGALWEARVKWSRLGVDAGTAMSYHVSLGTALDSAIDNVGATDGGAGSTAFRSVSIAPDRTASTAPGRTIQLPHWVENSGNVPVVISLQVRSATGQDITLWNDTDLDAVPDTWMAFDKGGDGLLTLPGDALGPAGDSNGDGVLDTGLLDMEEGILLYIEETFAADSGGLTEQIDIDGWIGAPGSPTAHNRDLIRVGSVTIAPDERRSGVAGDVAWVPHVVQNNTFGFTPIDLSIVSTRGWTWEIFADPDRDGLPADAVPLADSDGSGLVDVVLQPSQFAAILARATVPASASLGQQEVAYVRAHLSGIPQSAVTDRVTVLQSLDLLPSYLLADGQARYGGAGSRIYFAHRAQNHRGLPDDFTLAASSDIGWPVSLLTDPDRDGRPYDSQPMLSPVVTLPPNGGEVAFIVAVDVPAATLLGELSRIDVSATTSLGAVERVQDDAIAAIIRVYPEAAHVVSVSRIGSCQGAYAYATGLAPAMSGYRFAWRDPAGATYRVQDVTTDAVGTCEDSMVLDPGQAGAGWRIDIELWDGIAWQVLDTATFEIGDGWQVRDLSVSEAPFDISAPRITASAAMANDSFDQPFSDEIRWIVLNADRSAYLDGNGAFLAFTGVEATSRIPVLLEAREQQITLLVSNVRFPGTGTYLLEAWRSSTCSGEQLGASMTFEVIDDSDGDGLPRDREIAAGTDPADNDTDDDGVTDGADGLADSDGDGAIDALDCDSDDDGLTDGLESGVWEPATGTAPGSPCFVADTWPATTTDPRNADTDAGGTSDGNEDSNGNGRVDAGERDPAAAADDFVGCSALPPAEVTNLRVTRVGAAAHLEWTPVTDACVTHDVLAADTLPTFNVMASGLALAQHDDASPVGASGMRAYLIRAVSSLSGSGP